jgi:hypothetical protein
MVLRRGRMCQPAADGGLSDRGAIGVIRICSRLAVPIALGIGAGYRAWDSLNKKLDGYHAQNKESLRVLSEEKEGDLVRVHGRLDKHSERIEVLRREVDGHGYRLSAVEKTEG